MTQPHTRMLFVNLCIADLKRSMQFFSKLGFEFNPEFTDDNAACMIVNPHAFVMLLTEPFFKGFTKKAACNTATHSEGLFALSCAERADVDATLETALQAGASVAMPPVDHGFMYVRTFYDLDGHHWEVVWMDPSAVAAKN